MRQIRLCGSGGQGLVIAGRILAQAAFRDGKFVSLSLGYGSQVRGGLSRSDLVVSESFIDFPLVSEVDLLVGMLQEAYDESLSLVKADGLVLYDSTLVRPVSEAPARQIGLPAAEKAAEALNTGTAANIVMVAALNVVAGVASEASLEQSIRSSFSPAVADLNLQAMMLGRELARDLAA